MKARIFPVIVFYVLLVACANITTPNGGPKDKKPPDLVQSTPANKQINYKGRTVELVFDEMVKLNNPKEEIIISPSPGKEIDIIAKKNKVIVTPKDGWKDSTTYTLMFRDGVQDVTENNSPVNLKLAFSTTTTIDSLRVTGHVEELLKGVPVEKITVAIYSIDTFDIFTDTPDYFTKTDKKGYFSIENLKSGDYKIYAFDDKNKNLKVESRSERFGFLARNIPLKQNKDSLFIGIITLDSRPLKLTAIRNIGNVTRVRFNKHLTEYHLDGKPEPTHAFGSNHTEINLWFPENATDSIQMHLTATDSIESAIDTIFYIKKTDTKPIKESFKWSLGSPAVDPATGKFKTVMEFSKPITIINFDSIYIELDSVNRVAITKDNIEIDTKLRQITITKEIDKKVFKTEEELNLKLRAGSRFIYTIDGDSSKQQTVPVSIQWPEDAGVLFVQTVTPRKSFIIQLLDGQGKLVRSVANVAKYSFDKLSPGDYQLRIIIDENNNGKWDPGNYQKGIVPEKVVFYRNAEGKQTFPMRANWEYGPLILKF